jgi:hypothetical protein
MARALCAALLMTAVVVCGQTPAEAPSFVHEATLPAPIADVWRVWSTGATRCLSMARIGRSPSAAAANRLRQLLPSCVVPVDAFLID